MTNVLSRSALLSRGATGAFSLVCAGSIAGSLAPSAAAATIPDADLAYARLLVGTKYLKRAFFAEHLASVSGILTGAAQTPATTGDFDSFTS
jgi:hypothetical protein